MILSSEEATVIAQADMAKAVRIRCHARLGYSALREAVTRLQSRWEHRGLCTPLSSGMGKIGEFYHDQR